MLHRTGKVSIRQRPVNSALGRTLNIRPYMPADWERVCQIHDASRLDELSAAGLLPAFLTLEQTAENEGFLDYEIRVAELGDIVVGFVAFNEEELAWLYVDPAAYRQGVGTALIHTALKETKAPLCAEVLDGNDAAIAVYLKCGFSVVGQAHGRMPGNESFHVSVTELRHPGAA